MHADLTTNNLNAPATWPSELACPVCLSALHAQQHALVCSGCGRAYPVVDGIPVLITERAVEPSR